MKSQKCKQLILASSFSIPIVFLLSVRRILEMLAVTFFLKYSLKLYSFSPSLITAPPPPLPGLPGCVPPSNQIEPVLFMFSPILIARIGIPSSSNSTVKSIDWVKKLDKAIEGHLKYLNFQV